MILSRIQILHLQRVMIKNGFLPQGEDDGLWGPKSSAAFDRMLKVPKPQSAPTGSGSFVRHGIDLNRWYDELWKRAEIAGSWRSRC